MQAFVSKARRPEFELHLRIIDLNNVPLVSGSSFIKWNLPSSNAAEHRGRTPKSAIKDHKVLYDYDKVIPVRLVIGRDQMLQETLIHFEILQEYSSGGKGERITLGVLDLNLSEYVDESGIGVGEGTPESVCRRYLMQQSKINSTLKIEICMKYIRGDKNYIVPPLRTAPVFGGIAGIMSYEADAADDTNHLQSPQGRGREMSERQDLYRFVLAASWAAAPGQLRADKCIDDIFSGGDGWGSKDRRARAEAKGSVSKRGFGSTTDDDGRGHDGSAAEKDGSRTANISSFFRRADKGGSRHGNKQKYHETEPTNSAAVGGRRGLEAQAGKVGLSKQPVRQLQRNEVDEFDSSYRDDLRSWTISNKTAFR